MVAKEFLGGARSEMYKNSVRRSRRAQIPVKGFGDRKIPDAVPYERSLAEQSEASKVVGFFDANSMIGRYNLFRPGSFYTKERLLREMEYYGISEALVFHAVSMENSPQIGNQLTLKELVDTPFLHPVWTLLPAVPSETSPPEVMVQEMQRFNVRVARLFPLQFHFDLDDWCLGEVLESLSNRRIPVIIDYFDSFMPHSDRTDWRSVVEVCRRHPDLPVIITEFRFRTNRRLYQAMDKCPNLYIELSALWLFRAVESICRRFGAERLIFGTRLPIRDPSCALGMVNYAMISEEEKEMVAGKNLRKLMEALRHD